MKIRQIAKRAGLQSRLSSIAFSAMFDHYWHPSAIEGGCDDEFWDDGSDYYLDEPDDGWNEDYADDDDCDIDTCTGCGMAYGIHAGLSAWDRDRERCVAPQLCHRCWRDQGYAWPETKAA